MKLQVMSDLHLEMHKDWGVKFIESLNSDGVDALALAGDITSVKNYQELMRVFEAFTKKYKKIFYVPGNHEYYGSTPQHVVQNLRRLVEQFPQVSWLQAGDVVEFEGRRFLGDTMWFKKDPMAFMFHKDMADFSVIKDFDPWVYKQNTKWLEFLAAEMKEGDIVITHHLPTHKSVPQAFVSSPINIFFLCNVADLILDKAPAIWIHGHTHTKCDYMVDKTRVVCNPHGYPRETRANVSFVDRFILDL